MRVAVPMVESAHHADALCVGRPDGETRARGIAAAVGMRAELIVDALVLALAEQVEIEIGNVLLGQMARPHTTGLTAHIRSAYSRILRSLEKYPMLRQL